MIIDPELGHYYVSVVDGPQFALLLGPFKHHQDALARVDAVRHRAEHLDPRAVFYAFGTCRIRDNIDPLPVGRLNDLMVA